VYEDGEVSVGAGVDSVEVDAQTQLVAAGGRVEARAVQRASRRAGRLATTSGHLADRPHVRTDVLPAYRQVTANQKKGQVRQKNLGFGDGRTPKKTEVLASLSVTVTTLVQNFCKFCKSTAAIVKTLAIFTLPLQVLREQSTVV